MISDYKNPESTTGAMSFWKYLADDYHYGFNGMEKEPLPLFNSFSISR
ncbi:MAG: hypothetical protein KDC55_12380 [Ignavibacteriae bacterium]|nr:hypothetical protein [Ignavibacteriota bacterium]MCB9221629.1 hypothetical protein [Ignavibacteria bacterium]